MRRELISLRTTSTEESYSKYLRRMDGKATNYQPESDVPHSKELMSYVDDTAGKPCKVTLYESTAPGERYCDVFREELDNGTESTETDNKKST